MSKTCTHCGAAIDSAAVFCTHCGGRVSADSAVDETVRRRRRLRRGMWLIVVLALGILIGWLLPHKTLPCVPMPRGSATPMRNSGPGGEQGGGPLGGSKGGGGGGGGAGGENKNASTTGSGSSPGMTGESSKGGPGGAGEPASDNGANGAGAGTDPAAGNGHLPPEQGEGRAGGEVSDGSAESKSANALSAQDFTYDKTGLPRYPNAVQSVESGIEFPTAGKKDEYRTHAAIATGDSFEEVVTWYQKSLPGWRSETSGDFAALARQLSAQNMLQAVQQAELQGAGASRAPPAPATAASLPPADAMRISVLSPPAGTAAAPGVMIVQKGTASVTVMLKASTAN